MVGPAPGSAELRSLRGPTLKHLEQWLARLPYGVNGGYDDHSDQMGAEDVEEPEVTGPGGGEGYGGLFKVAVGPLGDRWVCRGCVSRHLGLTVEAIRAAGATSVGGGSETSPYLA
ncbi:hypothetical protein BGW38_005691 [Lunasporangiospora selenospora]|uniref:Uncharacterized protein n=1 Tax=Lunasporangiospora selenospora TaxID=979761 RepID=A0A9P6FPL4_9FUNG|nr:hypothetical protein BGW38_005691 [Lunasporangiospora selenospora]